MDKWLFKAVPYFIVFCFVAMFACWIFIAVIAANGIAYVEKNGIKSLVEQIWEGSRER